MNTDDLSAAFSAAVRESLAKLREGEVRVREARDLEGVHLMRTSARRLRSAVQHLGGHLPGGERRRLGRALKDLMTVLSPVRDLDVLVHAVGASEVLAPADSESLKSGALSELAGPVRLMTEHLDGPDHAKLLADLEAAAAAPGDGSTVSTSGPKRLLKAVGAVLAGRPDDWAKAGDEALHELRKDVKRLRYALEAFRPSYGRPVAELVERCRDLQEALGAIQDAAAFAGTLRNLRTFAAGQFLAAERMRAVGRREELPGLWKRAFGPKMLGRLGAHLLRRCARPARAAEESAPAPELRTAV